MWLNKAIQKFKPHKRKTSSSSSSTPYDLILREKEKIQSESENKKQSELSNQPRLNSSIDPLTNIDNNIIEPTRSRTKIISPTRSRRSRSRSISPVFRDSFENEEINHDGLHRRSRSSGSITSQERPNLIRRQSSLDIMRDLANEEREMASINLSQSLPEGFKVDERNW